MPYMFRLFGAVHCVIIHSFKLLISNIDHVCVFLKVCAELEQQDALVSHLSAPSAALRADVVMHQERTGQAAALHQGNTGLHESAGQVTLF